jgi:hypothetical protein
VAGSRRAPELIRASGVEGEAAGLVGDGRGVAILDGRAGRSGLPARQVLDSGHPPAGHVVRADVGPAQVVAAAARRRMDCLRHLVVYHDVALDGTDKPVLNAVTAGGSSAS